MGAQFLSSLNQIEKATGIKKVSFFPSITPTWCSQNILPVGCIGISDKEADLI